LDQIFGQHYRIRVRLDYTMKILDWMRIAKIFVPFTNSRRGHSHSPLKFFANIETCVTEAIKLISLSANLLCLPLKRFKVLQK